LKKIDIIEKITIVTILHDIMMNEGVNNRPVHIDFCWPRALGLKNTLSPAPALHKQLKQKVLVRVGS